MEKKNSTFRIIKWFYFLLIVSLIGYNIYYITGPGFNESINSYNKRLSIIEDDIIRGNIYDRNNEILATTNVYDQYKERFYPYHEMFAHVVGYSHQGTTGIEALANIDLLKSHDNFSQQVLRELSFEPSQGDHVHTTLDAKLQTIAYNALGDNDGAVIAIEPSTGQILAMVSKPSFDPNEVINDWDKLIGNTEETPLLNRGTQGLYPPGSTFKIVTTTAYLLEHAPSDFFYFCQGSDYFGQREIVCYNNNAHGREDLKDIFVNSCNTGFAYAGQDIEPTLLNETANRLLFNKPLPYPLPSSQSLFYIDDDSGATMMSETVIGQGKTLITPLHNLLITAAIANGGILMEPYLLDYIESDQGEIIEKYLPNMNATLFTTEESRILTEYMTAVVDEGTGKLASSKAFDVAGKTGSAELDTGVTHAWFVGFAPANNPEIAVVVLVEDGKSGGMIAAPIAKELFDYYLE